jgi:hypothetical protein
MGSCWVHVAEFNVTMSIWQLDARKGFSGSQVLETLGGHNHLWAFQAGALIPQNIDSQAVYRYSNL